MWSLISYSVGRASHSQQGYALWRLLENSPFDHPYVLPSIRVDVAFVGSFPKKWFRRTLLRHLEKNIIATLLNDNKLAGGRNIYVAALVVICSEHASRSTPIFVLHCCDPLTA